MIFTTHCTGSKGNLYTLSSGRTSIIIECGIPYRKIQKLLNYKLRDYSGVLVSHAHADHSRSVTDIIKRGGLDVFLSEGARYALLGDKKHHRSKVVKAGQMFKVGVLKIIPFSVTHDAVEPLAFVISGEANEVLLFATDLMEVPKGLEIKGLTRISIECNYNNSSIMRNYYKGALDEVIYRRITENHMGLEDVLEFLDRTDISKVREITLLHDSLNNCNIEECAEKIQETTGINTTFYGDKRNVVKMVKVY